MTRHRAFGVALLVGATLSLGASMPPGSTPESTSGSTRGSTQPPGRANARADASGPASSPVGYRSTRSYDSVAAPVRLRIASLSVDTTLDRVGLAPDGSIAAPPAWQRAAWYEAGPRPGQRGPAVIVGHVDSRTGPAVFARLAGLPSGAPVVVDRDDGSSVRFRVTGRRQVPKDAFPAATVYSPTLQASLILMTCGGAFDAATGHYVDNVLVVAVPE